MSPHCTTLRRRSFGLWAWVLGAMLLAQSLGPMHRMVHAGGSSHVDLHDGIRDAERHDRGDASWLDLLFSTHDDESDCRLYDQASRGGCLWAIAAAWPPAPATTDRAGVHEAWYPSAAAAFAQARGPPSLR